MDKMMKKTFSTLIALVLVTASISTIEAQQSDFEIQQNFQTEYQELVHSIDNAESSEELSEIAAEMEEFEAEYRGSQDLIDSAIYPDTFSSRMDNLRDRYTAAEYSLSTIEELSETVEGLRAEIETFRGDLSEMDERAEQLRSEIESSQANERQLSALVRQYRENLEERDKFVTEFMDQLLKRYETIDPAAAEELTEAAERLDVNPVDVIQTIVGEYINHTNQATDLNAQDYLRMSAQHAYFNDVWQRVGEQLTAVFEADAPVQAHQEVTDLIANWNSAINNKIWGSLSDAFAQNDIDLANFTSADTFYNALLDYARENTEVSMDQNREEDLDRYRNFSNFWNHTVKGEWGDYLTEAGILSHQEMSNIDLQLEEWNQAAAPTSNLMLILFLISVAVIIGLVVALVSKK